MDIELVLGDITTQSTDAIVNAANSGLMGGGGVDGALLRAGGAVQQDGRRRLRDRIGRLPTGAAAASEPGQLSCSHLIHVVGPVYGAGSREELSSCYTEALRVADEIGARSVAFPAVSAGIYGWPLDDAAAAAVQAVRAASTRVQLVRFVLFSQDVYDAFEQALRQASEG
jgi:O-acetyl-ADP-ribose deacetylase (regulator of RNase III)